MVFVLLRSENKIITQSFLRLDSKRPHFSILFDYFNDIHMEILLGVALDGKSIDLIFSLPHTYCGNGFGCLFDTIWLLAPFFILHLCSIYVSLIIRSSFLTYFLCVPCHCGYLTFVVYYIACDRKQPSIF